MAKKAKRTTTRKKNSKKTKKGTVKRLLIAVLLIGALASAAILLWLNEMVQERFDSHQWELPARVYARSVELYKGRALEMDHLRKLLQYMHYRNENNPNMPGTYSINGNTAVLYTRGFRDSDGGEKAGQLRIQISNNRIASIQDGSGNAVSVARLEPLHIGSIHPGHEQDRVLVRLEDTPPQLIEMLVAVEDRKFYKHHGVSPRGLARAMAANIKSGGFHQGGSTLTQQLVKNFWLTRDRTLSRKLLELPMAVLLEMHYGKEEILETYLNEVYLGQDGGRAIHGMGLASMFYFGQPVEELAPHQLALLVGMLKGPGLYNPNRNPEQAQKRRNVVLDVAEDAGIIDAETAEKARKAPLGVVAKGDSTLYAFPDFVDLVRRQLARDYPEEVLSREGLVVHSTLDVLAQVAAEDAVVSAMSQKDPDEQNKLNASVMLTAPDQGDVLAVVGSRKPRSVGFNRALDASRPIGSLVKPMVLLTALQNPTKYHLGSIIEDEPITVTLPKGKTWKPNNVDNKSLGEITLTDMLAKSRNQATVRLGMDVKPKNVLSTLERLGLRKKVSANPSMLLGSLELTPFSVATLYQPIATNGFQTALRSITDVLDSNGKALARYPVQPESVFESDTMFLVQWAMTKVMREGTGRAAMSQLPNDLNVAGKTGTSGGYRDAWFAGFSDNHLAVVWVGRDDNQPANVSGSSAALPIWTDLMSSLPQRSLRMDYPAGVEEMWWDAKKQKGYDEECDDAVKYPILLGTDVDLESCKKGIFNRSDSNNDSRSDDDETEKRGIKGWWKKRFGK